MPPPPRFLLFTWKQHNPTSLISIYLLCLTAKALRNQLPVVLSDVWKAALCAKHTMPETLSFILMYPYLVSSSFFLFDSSRTRLDFSFNSLANLSTFPTKNSNVFSFYQFLPPVISETQIYHIKWNPSFSNGPRSSVQPSRLGPEWH